MDRDRAVGDRARTSADRAGRRDAPAAPQPNRRTAAAVLRLQAAAGNRAVARLLARDVVRDPQHKALGIKFTVGVEIRIGLAQKAQQLAAGGIDDAKLRQLRAEALTVDETIDDDERMFMAGLLDPDNAHHVAAARIAAGTAFTFPRASIERHAAHVHDLDRPAIDPRIASERDAAAHATSFGAQMAHTVDAERDVVEQLTALTGGPGSPWHAKLAAALDFATANGARLQGLLEAMVSAASDGTEGDRVMAATVYAVAAAAGDAMADAVRTGRIKVDQVAPGSKAAAEYFALAEEPKNHPPGGKGDTVYVPSTLDINNLADRSNVIHELAHAADDAASGPNVRHLKRDHEELQAYLAGARYSLAQASGLVGKEQEDACRQIAASLSAPQMAALVYVARMALPIYAPIVRTVNRFASSALAPSVLDQWLDRNQMTDNAVLARALDLIRSPTFGYGIEDAAGNEIPGANDVTMDGLAGESVLDWVDRR